MGGPFPDNFPRYQLSGEITGRLVPGGHYRIPVHWKLSALSSSGHGPTKRVNEWPRSPGEMNSQLIDGKPGNGTRRGRRGMWKTRGARPHLPIRIEVSHRSADSFKSDEGRRESFCRMQMDGKRDKAVEKENLAATPSQPTAVRKIALGHVFHSLTLLAAETRNNCSPCYEKSDTVVQCFMIDEGDV